MCRHPRADRALCAVLVMMFAVVQLAGIVHATETRHVRCVEHGELVDVVDGVAGPMSPTLDHGQRPRDHEHCPFAQTLRDHGVAPPSAPALAATCTPAPPPPCLLAATAARVATLYRLAPKTSPPVA